MEKTTVCGIDAARYISMPGTVVVRQLKKDMTVRIGRIDLPTNFNLAEKVCWSTVIACSDHYCEFNGAIYDGEITCGGKKAWPLPVGSLVQHVPVQIKKTDDAPDEQLLRSVDCRAWIDAGTDCVHMLPGSLIVEPCDGPAGAPAKMTKGGIALPDIAVKKEAGKWGKVLAVSDQFCVRTGGIHRGKITCNQKQIWPINAGVLVRYVPQNPWTDDNRPDRELIKTEDLRACVEM